MTEPSTPPGVDYPVHFSVDYPQQLERLSTALRIFWVIPIAIVIGALTPAASRSAGTTRVLRPRPAAAGYCSCPCS